MIADFTEHLVELELRLQAPSTRCDRAALVALLSEAFREFGASGRVWRRGAIIERLSPEPGPRLVSDQFRCDRLSNELALLTYECRETGSRNVTRRTLRSSLWRLEGDTWRMLFHQGTVVPPA